MTQEQFVASRRPRWEELQGLLGQVRQKGVAALELEQVRRLGELYRLTASDLAYARTFYPGAQVTVYLNGLAGRAHAVVYAPAPRRMRELWLALAAGVPQAVRRHYRAVLLAAACLLGGMAAGAAAAAWAPETARAWLPPAFRELTPSPDQGEIPPEVFALFSAQVLVNNLRVAALAFGLGLTFGAGTAWILLQNGAMVGVIAALFISRGFGGHFFAVVAAHGVLELMAIVLAGAAGLVLAGALVSPGRLTRRQAMQQARGPALTMILGAAPMLAVAALVEGFITPVADLPPALKVGLGVALGLGALAWWLRGATPGPAASTPGTGSPLRR